MTIVRVKDRRGEETTDVKCLPGIQVFTIATAAAYRFGLPGDLWTLALPEDDHTVFAQTAYLEDLPSGRTFTLHELSGEPDYDD